MKEWSKLKKAVVISTVGIFGLIGLGSLGNSTSNIASPIQVTPSPTAVQGAQTTRQTPAEPAVSTPILAAPVSQPTPTPEPVNCPNETYVNVSGNIVCSPYAAPTTSAGATAQCVDGTYSFSQHHSGTCSHHGGVSTWL